MFKNILALITLLTFSPVWASTLDLSATFPGADTYSSVTNVPAPATYCIGNFVDGVQGTGVCLNSLIPTASVTLPTQIVGGTALYDSHGYLVTGTMSLNSPWNLQTASFATAGGNGHFPSVTNVPAATAYCTGTTLFGTAGTPICQSGSAATPAAASDVLAGQQAFDTTGAIFSGTLVDRSTWNITTTFPGVGKYSGVTTVPAASSICSYTTLLGVAGTTICEKGTSAVPAAAASDILTSKDAWDSTGTIMNGSIIPQGSWNLTTGFPGAGKYTGFTANPAAATICTGTNAEGTVGTAICEASAAGSVATVTEILAGFDVWDATGTKITGTIPNNTFLNVSLAFPGAGFFGSTVGALPASSQLCNTVHFLGDIGTSFCGQAQASNANHDKATTQISQAAEAGTYAGIALPSGGGYTYRDVPIVSKDTDGFNGVTQIYEPRPVSDCGTSGTLAARIQNCNVTWNGATQGNSGQATWTLVTRNGSNKEVWQDQRTGLLWSSLVAGVLGGAAADTWCLAAGNSSGTDATCAGNAFSYCAETGLSPAAALGENWGVGTASYSAAKGLMGKNSVTVVRWALPTFHDYQQAELDGIRMVMPDMGIAGASRPAPHTALGSDPGVLTEWAATVVSTTPPVNPPANAWVFNAQSGIDTSASRSGTSAIRCVGR